METVPSASPQRPATSRIVLAALLAVSLIAAAAVAWLIVSSGSSGNEVIDETLEGPSAEALGVYRGEVIDATGRSRAVAVAGHRYKVEITDESKEGAAGVAKIGGLVTFVRGARKGEVVVIEVTRLKRTSAEAAVVERLAGTGSRAVPAADILPDTEPVRVGGTYRAVIKDVGKKGDGIARVGGKVVFVAKAKKGEEVVFTIVEDKDSFARAELVSRGASEPRGAAPADSPASPADDVQPGKTFDVTVTEKDNKDPAHNGVARIAGLVVFVPSSQPGDRVRIRIVERAPRFARSEVVERLGGTE